MQNFVSDMRSRVEQSENNKFVAHKSDAIFEIYSNSKIESGLATLKAEGYHTISKKNGKTIITFFDSLLTNQPNACLTSVLYSRLLALLSYLYILDCSLLLAISNQVSSSTSSSFLPHIGQ
ncbi:hypothetical protein [Enterococcus sp. DIV0212c]|uniref:hypothetical protein n=1 Tax=Enterococcus sp. DIV0212c TaxID=2230867 RepID=UPI001A9AA077|nr:hypothetical protein [Enterococcus sp. DIV0212c]MBO1354003.1 hypothetical protein [Enterococcus sp. DIV0212c]